MAVKKCCIEKCKSSSIRKEDVGVTYHKYPKDNNVRNIWISVTRQTPTPDLPWYVCSRHFCKNDFQLFKESKYVLKSDAVPSIFSWNIKNKVNGNKMGEPIENVDKPPDDDKTDVLNSSKESEPENVDAIKKFIEEQDKNISQNADKSDVDNKSVEDTLLDVDDTPNVSCNKNKETEMVIKNQKLENKEELDKEVKSKEEYKAKDVNNTSEDTIQDKSSKDKMESLSEAINANKNSKVLAKNGGEYGNLLFCQLLNSNKNMLSSNKNTSSNIFKGSKQDPIISEFIPEESSSDTMQMAASVLDTILTQSVTKIATKKSPRILPKVRMGEKGGVALSVGSKVEARDYGEDWYPAQIMEVDYDEMEVLVHYENINKKHDEWISVSSPRLRPVPANKPATPSIPSDYKPAPNDSQISNPHTITEIVSVKEEPKEETKPKLTFEIGERCLARWRDNRRFIATITKDLGNGKYEIVFDDGAPWSCTVSRLYKLKEPLMKKLTVDITSLPATQCSPSPDIQPVGTVTTGSVSNILGYNTHLFDPARDYLGSKSERREMKRKLNIKEIFNIGQKKKKVATPKEETPVKGKKKRVIRSKPRQIIRSETVELKTEVKKEIPDAIASIIGTVSNEQNDIEIKDEVKDEGTSEVKEELLKCKTEDAGSETLSAPESQTLKIDEPVEEEAKLEKFEVPADKHEQVIGRIKEAIIKLEDGLIKAETPKTESKEQIKTEEIKSESQEKPKKSLSKIKKSKKLRLLQEKKVKREVEIVKTELEEMKKQVEEMKKQMLKKTEELAKSKQSVEMPESFLLPGEWCCKWVNGQPVGSVSEVESVVKNDGNNKPALPRRSVQVEDKRLPPGWTKHMVRRSVGHSAGKWDVVLINPENKRFHTKTDMRNYFENNPDESLKAYEHALFDFGVHLKLSRRMGWYVTTPDGQQENPTPLPAGILSTTSPLVKRKNFSLKRSLKKEKKKLKKKSRILHYDTVPTTSDHDMPGTSGVSDPSQNGEPNEFPPLEDGYVYVGSLKVQIIENLLRCPAEGCFKNFRNNTLLKMHIKHYHRELKKMLGATPKVLDLAYARAKPTQMEMRRLKLEAQRKTIKIKLPRLPKRLLGTQENNETPTLEAPFENIPPVKLEEKIPRSLDSPKLRKVLMNRPIKRPKVLLPVRRPDTESDVKNEIPEETRTMETFDETPIPYIEPLDFETAISTHTVTKPVDFKHKEKKRKTFASIAKKTVSDEEDWFGINNSDVETRSSYPRSGTPDSKILDQKLVSSESNEEQREQNMYMYNETGERIKIVHMKREEIINCHCGFREEDGLMVQCELCLCWQHALCHNIQKESEVPEKYTCSICLNPRRGRRSRRFLHDQDRLYEGLLPGAKPCEALRRSHELSGNLIRIEDALHALRVKYQVATKKNHPKLYLWAKDWETGEIAMTQEKLNSDYSDLNVMMASIGKENLPLKPEEMKTPPSEEVEGDRFSQRDQLGSQSLLSGLLSSPDGASLDLPLSSSELDKLAKSVQEQDLARIMAPQPEAAIENSACRERLLRHIQRCQALIDARLDSIEAQVAELESQDPSFEDDETADYFPRTKQTIQMLMRDLDTMEELGVIT